MNSFLICLSLVSLILTIYVPNCLGGGCEDSGGWCTSQSNCRTKDVKIQHSLYQYCAQNLYNGQKFKICCMNDGDAGNQNYGGGGVMYGGGGNYGGGMHGGGNYGNYGAGGGHNVYGGGSDSGGQIRDDGQNHKKKPRFSWFRRNKGGQEDSGTNKGRRGVTKRSLTKAPSRTGTTKRNLGKAPSKRGTTGRRS